MKPWYHEDWRFTIQVVHVGQEDQSEACRLGLEPGDTFDCAYGTPAGFCPTAYIKLFPCLEVVRCAGDLRNLGGTAPDETTWLCPDGVVLFRLTARQVPE